MVPKKPRDPPSWRNQAITWGVAIVILGGMGSFIAAYSHHRQEVKDVAREALRHHAERHLDKAHPSLPKLYVTKRELNSKLHKIDTQLTQMRIQQDLILQRLPNLNKWFDLKTWPLKRKRRSNP